MLRWQALRRSHLELLNSPAAAPAPFCMYNNEDTERDTIH